MLALCLRKDRANAVLRAHGIPVPEWILVRPDSPPGAVAPVPGHRQARRRGRVVRDRRRLRGQRSGRARGRRGAWMPAVGPHARPALRRRPGVQPGHRRRAGAPPRRDRLQPPRSGTARGGDVRGEVGVRKSGGPGDGAEMPRAPAGPARRAPDPARRARLGRRGRHRIRPHRRPGRRPGHDVRHGREPESGPRGPGGIGAPGGRRGMELPRPDRPDRRGRPHPRAPGQRTGSDSSGGARRRSTPGGGHALHPAPRAGPRPA